MSDTNLELERKLHSVIENSRVNAEIAQKLFDIETQILSCKTSKELLLQLLSSIREQFNLTDICLLLAEPTPVSYLLSGNMQSNWHQENSRSLDVNILKELHPSRKPFLTNDLLRIKAVLPPSLIKNAQSAAFTPLVIEDKLFGSLVFTDNNKARFHSDLGTIHLEQLAVKVSLCLSNALIRDQDSIYVKIANASCEKKSNSMKLTIHPLPALTLAITSPNTCAKSDIVITASATTLPATSHAYKFEISALGIIQDSTLSTFKFNAQNENSSFVETDYIDINGCKRTAYETVIVNELPDIDFSNDDLNGDSTICSDSPISFTGAINNLVDADLYTFKVNNLVVQSDGFEDVYLTDSLRENSKVKLIILTDEQCQDSVFVNIKVDTIPQLDIILSDALVASAIIPSGNAECQGGSVMFKDVLLQGSN